MADCLWSFEQRGDLQVVRCSALDVDGIGHVFTTAVDRQGRKFDVGPFVAHRDAEWRARVLCAAGLQGRILLDPHQVHGARVVDAAGGRGEFEADAVLALADEHVEFAPAVRSADCLPLLLVARDGRALAAVHAGWRGAAAGVVQRTLARLSESGVAPSDLVAAIGPAIGKCCYRVGEEVVDAMLDRFGPRVAGHVEHGADGTRLGLGGLIREALIELGLDPAAVHLSPWCTSCAELPFFSYRRQGKGAGRQIACVGWLTA